MSFFQQLEQRIAAVDSLLCVGLDPHVAQLSSPSAEAAKQFCLDIIHQTHPFAACFKPNSAFFEVFGAEGSTALAEVLQAIPAGIPVILDVKRGDIDTTALAYAEAALGALKVGCVTLSPYMGTDSIKPFVTGKYADRAAFILCKTSNPSSKVPCVRLELFRFDLMSSLGAAGGGVVGRRSPLHQSGEDVCAVQRRGHADQPMRLPESRPRRWSH